MFNNKMDPLLSRYDRSIDRSQYFHNDDDDDDKKQIEKRCETHTHTGRVTERKLLFWNEKDANYASFFFVVTWLL